MRRIAKTAIVILFLGIAVGAVGYLGHKSYTTYKTRGAEKAEQKERAELAQRKKKDEELAKKAAEEKAKAEAKELQRRLRLATIGKGEGVEHAFKRQLMDNPAAMAGIKVKIGKKEYELTFPGGDEQAVKKWINRTAHLLAIAAGYVDRKTGRQIGVKKPGKVAYLFAPKQKDSVMKLDVKIYQKKAEEAEFTHKPTTSIIDPGHEITFWADVTGGIASFEYVWTPAKAKTKKTQET